MNERVLVTGGSGYLAGWVIAELLDQGYRVRTTVRDADRSGAVRAAVAEASGGDAAGSIEFAVADLLDDAGWAEAMRGVDYVVHTASPLGFTPGEDVVRTAREGVRRVLGAASRAGVRRTVLTSSGVAAVPSDRSVPASETVWAEASGSPRKAYNDSKIHAERDAWSLAAETGLELAAVLPTFMQGPPLGAPGRQGSVEIVRRLLAGGVPAIPNVGWDVVDVRDVARLHLLAMTSPAAAGERFIGSGGFLWWRDIARLLRERLPAESRKVPRRRMPDGIVRLLGRGNPQLAMLGEQLGIRTVVDGSKAQRVLGWRSRPVEQTIVDTARALVAKGALEH